VRQVGSSVGPLTPHLYVPTAERPVRAKLIALSTEQRVVPHSHPWAQLAFSATGVTRLTVDHGSYLVPPSRALWIPAGVEHAVTVVEDAAMLTLYLHQPRGGCGPAVPAAERDAWRRCRVLEVSELLRALALALDTRADGDGPALDGETLRRERLLSTLVQDELRRAKAVPLGIALPRDKRLRALCEAVLDDPARHRTLQAWARDSGASSRTIARLFREQLGVSFGQWRQQVFLARALSLATKGKPMAAIAGELGYASASAFTAMVRRTVGAPPKRFFAAAA
jgi:AraC-like DNA-binding protein/quercetin dioxygenase-like cupin family protein